MSSQTEYRRQPEPQSVFECTYLKVNRIQIDERQQNGAPNDAADQKWSQIIQIKYVQQQKYFVHFHDEHSRLTQH